MSRLLAATTLALIASAVAVPAMAADTQVCIVTATETLTPPRKPNIIETDLDCGASPDDMQQSLATTVHNAMNAADAVELMTNAGYKVASADFRNSYTGHQIIGVYTMVMGTGASVAPPAKKPMSMELPEADDLDDMDADKVDDAKAPMDDGPIELE
ncbi:MAG: hypothetical protein H6733_13715 [Alphaproteobacteria bacterium]|nr:hypothetical protein [Alphaproteobacteria bacterium]